MALLIRASLQVALLICVSFKVSNCRGSRDFLNDPAAVWLLESSKNVEKVSSDEITESSSKTDVGGRIDRLITSPPRSNNRRPVSLPSRPYRTRGDEQRNNAITRPKWQNPTDDGRQATPLADLSKKSPNSEIHIEVDSLDQIEDILNNLFKSNDIDVGFNRPGNHVPGNIPDVSSGVNAKWHPSGLPYTPRPYTSTERTVIRTLPSPRKRPYATSARPPANTDRYSPPATQFPYENFWVPPKTMPALQNLLTVTPRDTDKPTAYSPEGTRQDSADEISESPWEVFKNPFWGPPLASASLFPATSAQPTMSQSPFKERPNNYTNSPDDELDDYSYEEDDEETDEDEEHLESRQLDDDLPGSSGPPVAAPAPVGARNPEYGHTADYPYQVAAGNYYTPPSPMRLDFSPLFLALIPIALFLGAAASFALSSAVTSSTAVATAQQQQQQQQEGNNNNANNANSNNANTILSLLTALYQNDNNNNGGYFNNFPNFIVVNDTSIIGRRRRRVKRLLKLLD